MPPLRNLFRSYDDGTGALNQIGDATVDATQPQPAPAFDTNFSPGDAPDEVVWHGGSGYQKAEGGQPGAADGTSEEADPFADLFAGYEDQLGEVTQPGQQPQQGQPTYQPVTAPQQYGDMPEDFNAEFLVPGNVNLAKQRARLTFQGEAQRLANNPEALQLVNIAHQLAEKLIDQQAKYSNMTMLAKQMYDSNQSLTSKSEALDRLKAARILAEQKGIKDYRQLLRNPKTGQPIKSGAEMKLLADMLGEAQREANVQARANVDRPLNPVQATNAGRSIESIDPHSKAFEEIENAVAAGKHVRLLG